ncbi:MAG: cobalt transporter CbiM [Desulfobacterales bacterium]
MHISEGILTAPVLGAGAVLALAGTAVGLRRMDYERVARAGVMAAAFFIASLVHVPIGPTNIHLILNGLVGLLLGWAAFPAILTALLLQAVMFQFGGLTTLGVNTVIMALPAVLVSLIFAPLIRRANAVSLAAAFSAGLLSVLLAGLLMALALIFVSEGFWKLAPVIIAGQAPLMVIEGIITATVIAFIRKVRPEML